MWALFFPPPALSGSGNLGMISARSFRAPLLKGQRYVLLNNKQVAVSI